jgi:hypothetical protein
VAFTKQKARLAHKETGGKNMYRAQKEFGDKNINL